ncbi:ParB family transcriptional regulator, chromosome partitioning protein [Methylorubrum extorquens]
MRQIQVSSLRPGHHPDAPAGVVNVRHVGRDAGLDALAASILSLGLLQPLVTVELGGWFYVVDGNRRHAALESLLSAGKIAADFEVPVIERDAGTAREAGLAANVLQAPMHEADQMQAYAELRRAGMKEKDIATKFAVPLAQVKKLLALGGVSPAVLDAWRTRKIDLIAVQAFTMASHADQDRVLAKVLRDGSTWRIRHELGLVEDIGHLLSYVGAKNYKAAGGTIVEDLFGARDAVSDVPLLKRLADERLEAECVRRRQEGWLWVAKGSDLPGSWHWTWPRLKPSERPPTDAEQARLTELEAFLDAETDDGATDEQIRAAHDEMDRIEAACTVPLGFQDRARSGLVVSLGRDGKVSTVEYVVRPDDVPEKKEPTPATGAGEEPEEQGLSSALIDRLAEQATVAVQAALPSSPKAALAILLAGTLSESRGAGPVHVTLGGLGGPKAQIELSARYDQVLAGLLTKSVDELLDVAAAVAGRAVSLRHYDHSAPSDRPSAMALMGAIDQTALTKALGAAFDGEAYFKAIPKAAILQIVGEVLGEDIARRVKDKKKGELVEVAVASVLPTGWLPVEIRHPGYAGPGAVTAPAEVAAAA